MNRKILLVEAHDSLRQVIGAFLSKQFDVVGASNGLEALGKLSQGFFPDAIVTDARVPDISGTHLLSQIRCSGLFANIPVVVISGAENDEEELHFRQLGVHDYLRKPFSPTKLQDRLMQITG